MLFLSTAVSAILLAANVVNTATTPLVQASNLTQTALSKQRALAIKKSFQSSYYTYRKYAGHNDSLEPLSLHGVNDFGGFGATPIDALSTAIIMNDTAITNALINFATRGTDFTKTNATTLSLFETNIRYLGGLLSAYELTGKTHPNLIKQAKIVGDHLLTGWVGTNDIPYNTLMNWNTYGAPNTSTGAIIAEAGTLLLEMSKLSKYTKNNTYLDHAERSMKAVINSPAVFPGLYAQGINPVTNIPTDDFVTWGGGSDSFFEYLIKYAYMVGDSSSTYATTWIQSVQSSITNLLVKPYQHTELLYLSDYAKSYGGDIPRFSHLGCFAPGNWILGGKILGVSVFAEYGYELAASCIHTYTLSATGIGPESFVYKGKDGSTNGVTIANETQYDRAGFDYDSTAYILRPEVLESVFYSWRATGDPRWQELAWTAFEKISKYCKAGGALAGILEVNNTATAQYDTMQSFLFAELYKYLYLTFADPEVVNLDRYVFNTEGHPFELDNPGAFQARTDVQVPPYPQQAANQAVHTPTSSDRVPMPKHSGLPLGVAQSFISRVQQVVHSARRGLSPEGSVHRRGAHPPKFRTQRRIHALF